MDLPGIFLPLILVLQFLLGYLNILDELNIAYFPMIDGETHFENFDLGFNPMILLLILLGYWVVIMIWWKEWKAIPLSMSFLILGFFIGVEFALSIITLVSSIIGLWIFRPIREFAWNLMALLSALSLLSFFHWAILVPLGLKTPLKGLADFWLNLFYLHSNLAPLIVLPFLFFWFIKNTLLWIFERNLEREKISEVGSSRETKIILVLSLILAVYAAIYPYLYIVNPEGKEFGIDIPSYTGTINDFESDSRWLHRILTDTRPLFYLIIFGFRGLTGLSTAPVLRYFPVILNPLLIASVYYLGCEITGNSEVASYAAFFTATGFPLTAGMYSYYLTNNLGLVLVSFSLGLLFKAIHRDCYQSLALASSLGFMLVFTHPWTLDQYMAVMVVIFVITMYRYYTLRNDRVRINMVAPYIGAILVAELVKMASGGYSVVEATSEALNHLISVNEFWDSIIFTFRHLYGGFMSNLLLLGLALLGLYYLSYRELADEYLRWFIFITSLVFVLSTVDNKSRLLYNIPFGLYASMGLQKASTWMDARFVKGSALLYSAAYLFMCLANLV